MKRKSFVFYLLTWMILLLLFVSCASPAPKEEVEKNLREIEANEKDNIDDLEKEDEDEISQEAPEEIEDDYGIEIGEDSVTFIDGRDEEVTIPKNPQRPIVLFSSFVDIWVRNGGEIVGMIEDTSDEIIPGTEGVEKVGKTGSISLEKVIALDPDLVILSSNSKGQTELIPPLEENGIPLLIVDYNLKDDYFKVVRLFSALNERDDLYKENGEKIRAELEEIIEKVPEDENPKVFIMFASSKSITSRGSDSTTGEMLKDLGAINIADTAGELLTDKTFSMEKVLEEDPDFIFVQTMGSDMEKVMDRIKSDVESNPAWASLSAVKNDRYIFLPKDLYMYKANHRYPEAYEGLAKILYSEIFD